MVAGLKTKSSRVYSRLASWPCYNARRLLAPGRRSRRRCREFDDSAVEAAVAVAASSSPLPLLLLLLLLLPLPLFHSFARRRPENTPGRLAPSRHPVLRTTRRPDPPSILPFVAADRFHLAARRAIPASRWPYKEPPLLSFSFLQPSHTHSLSLSLFLDARVSTNTLSVRYPYPSGG